MSLVAGDVGSKTILPDGAQIDHLSENTVGHGVSIAGRTSGVAIEAGNVGEEFPKVTATITGGAIARWATFSPTAGTWLIIGTFSLPTGSGGTYIAGGIGLVDASNTGTVLGYSRVINTVANGSGCGTIMIVKQLTATTPIYLNGSTDYTVAGGVSCSLQAVRIA